MTLPARLLAAFAAVAVAGCMTPRGVTPRAAGSLGNGDTSLSRQLESAGEPGDGPRYFFLGVALSDRSPAFHGDIRIVDRILGHHYGAAYRSVLLSNREQVDEVRDLPLATRENVDAAIERLRAVRRPDDRFILLFTSHGARGVLAEQQRAAGNLNATVPSSLLGRWVNSLAPNRTWVIISACYSGSHLRAIQGAQVVAMTASDEDHMSLGCSTLDRSTYFVGALARSLDFERSFAEVWSETDERLRTWEARSKYPGAHPQLHFGEGLDELVQKPVSRF